MKKIMHSIKHLNEDVAKIHNHLEHLSSHSKICTELARESNQREAAELFIHLEEIDKLVHGVQNHIIHIRKHLGQDQPQPPNAEILDIDDLKHDAKHTSFDLKDIHIHIEHLISHTEMCQNIITPNAEKELLEIKSHLNQIDNEAHELLDHINEIRGEISSKYSEFIWSIPTGFDDYLQASKLIDSDQKSIEDLALRLVDGMESAKSALVNILCFVRDFIVPEAIKDHELIYASETLSSTAGSGIAKSILISALSRAVSISSQIHFTSITPETWQQVATWTEQKFPDIEKPFSISWPEFYFDDKWVPAFNVLDHDIDTSCLHENYIELGLKKPGVALDFGKWKKLPISEFKDHGVYSKPIKYLSSPNFSPPPSEIECKLFTGFIYIGQF